MNRTRVAVLRGGPSPEHSISLKTGESVLKALDPDRYEPLDVIVAKNGNWYLNGYELNPSRVGESTDVVFNALHGSYGEDGTVQRVLDRYSVPYTGSGAFASATAMNKWLTKSRLKDLGIKMAPHIKVSHDPSNDYNSIAASVGELFGPIYVIKPIAGGSSINTYIVNGVYELAKVLKELTSTEPVVLIEKYISGTEATCGVIENFRGQVVYSLPVVEIVPPAENKFFDLDAKYSGKTTEICPGSFPANIKKEIETITALVHEALELSQYSRSDFIVAPDGIYFLEVNTLPGLTNESLVTKSLGAVGATHSEFVDHLISEALVRPRSQ